MNKFREFLWTFTLALVCVAVPIHIVWLCAALNGAAVHAC